MLKVVEISTSFTGEVSIIDGLKNQILREVGAVARCIHTLADVKYREIKL